MWPLVSVIVSTRNEERVIGNALNAIRSGTYPNLELIVVDNASSDRTKDIARAYECQVYDHGPERSAQRNFGAHNSHGQYVLFVDADMELSHDVVLECVEEVNLRPSTKMVVIPEESFGTGYWSRCKALERSCYLGDDTIEAGRFFERWAFLEAGGYDTRLLGGEDWDLSQRVRSRYMVSRTTSVIRHNEGRLSVVRSMRKKFYYASTYVVYANRHRRAAVKQANLIFRPAFFRAWRRLLRHPFLSVGMLVMKTLEMAAAIAGGSRGLVRAHLERMHGGNGGGYMGGASGDV